MTIYAVELHFSFIDIVMNFWINFWWKVHKIVAFTKKIKLFIAVLYHWMSFNPEIFVISNSPKTFYRTRKYVVCLFFAQKFISRLLGYTCINM